MNLAQDSAVKAVLQDKAGLGTILKITTGGGKTAIWQVPPKVELVGTR